MNRRGILGLFAGAAVAGPSMAKAAVESVGQIQAANVGSAAMQASGLVGYSTDPFDETPFDVEGAIRQQIAAFTGMSDYEKRRLYGADSYFNQYQDPDIASYRSFSPAFKQRVQTERNYQRNIERQNRQMEFNLWRVIRDKALGKTPHRYDYL